MIFRDESVRRILEQRKTQTRRAVPEADRNGARRCRYTVGGLYAIQPARNKPGVGKLEVTAVRRERLGDMPATDARREGFNRMGKFRDAWVDIHGNYDPDQPVDVITFRLVSEERGGSVDPTESERVPAAALS